MWKKLKTTMMQQFFLVAIIVDPSTCDLEMRASEVAHQQQDELPVLSISITNIDHAETFFVFKNKDVRHERNVSSGKKVSMHRNFGLVATNNWQPRDTFLKILEFAKDKKRESKVDFQIEATFVHANGSNQSVRFSSTFSTLMSFLDSNSELKEFFRELMVGKVKNVSAFDSIVIPADQQALMSRLKAEMNADKND